MIINSLTNLLTFILGNMLRDLNHNFFIVLTVLSKDPLNITSIVISNANMVNLKFVFIVIRFSNTNLR